MKFPLQMIFNDLFEDGAIDFPMTLYSICVVNPAESCQDGRVDLVKIRPAVIAEPGDPGVNSRRGISIRRRFAQILHLDEVLPDLRGTWNSRLDRQAGSEQRDNRSPRLPGRGDNLKRRKRMNDSISQ
ncbi:MAG: hypothetical protein HY290_29530 [Planctomycetia bacterium]|nr:hypothetical protein [Planctomycetia bacterium]